MSPHTILFLGTLFIGMISAALVLAEPMPHSYNGIDPVEGGVYIVIFQEERDGWCYVEGRVLLPDEIHYGAFEDYLGGISWILGPDAMVPVTADDYQLHNLCRPYDDMTEPAIPPLGLPLSL